jgi:hypothetical protein
MFNFWGGSFLTKIIFLYNEYVVPLHRQTIKDSAATYNSGKTKMSSKMNKAKELYVITQIHEVMTNKNYRAAYEWAVKDAKERGLTERPDFFPYIFALDIRDEQADAFNAEVIGNAEEGASVKTAKETGKWNGLEVVKQYDDAVIVRNASGGYIIARQAVVLHGKTSVEEYCIGSDAVAEFETIEEAQKHYLFSNELRASVARESI